ncbi:TrkA C-terminal domain-containing protein [Halovivax sp.]|uniref:TrkA C-terminal domain-containing protein n=1 Tax=Halovivax sp. TaxID=1935978 RepID=UPI0025C49D47|nr:TrkA C-terminal domain-containing protein [Halovivax sp.]
MFEIGGESILWVLAQAVGLSLLAALVAGSAAFVFRLYTGADIPEGASLILGLGAVGLALNTRNVLIQFIGEGSGGLTVTAASIDIAIFVLAAVSASAGRLLGDRFATSKRFRPAALGSSLHGPLVRATGRWTVVQLPEEIGDIDGYEPVAEETKRDLEGRSFEFPARLSVEALRTKLVGRLKEEHDVGYVDLELEPDGTVAHLGLGRRPAGIGSTLPPGSVAVAVRCDPAFSASPGDSIQLWRSPAPAGTGEEGRPIGPSETGRPSETGQTGRPSETGQTGRPTKPGEGPNTAVDDTAAEPAPSSDRVPAAPERICTGELRAVVGTVATIIVDESVAASIDPTVTYRLVTLPSDVRVDREFAGMLRRADETMQAVEVSEGSPLVGAPLSDVDATVIAVRDADGAVETLPQRDRKLAAGDTVIALGRPAELRGLQRAANGRRVEPPVGDGEVARALDSVDAAE